MSEITYEVLNEDLNFDDVEVSISCITYNHKNYISTAIESFLMQKTDFKYRIYIHDDASTDGTQDILREYAAKYPDKIVVILQKKNLYSQGKRISSEYIYPRCKGKYVAICEGDDYWIDDTKLQKQYDYMEKHPDCYLCAHSGICVDANTQKPLAQNVYSTKESVFSMEDAIAGFGRTVLTNSFFQRIECCFYSAEFRWRSPCGDYIMPVIAALKGTIGYLPDIMSAYRVTSNKDSVTTRMRSSGEFRLRYTERYDAMLSALDEHTDHKYSEFIAKERNRIWFNYYVQVGDKKMLRSEPYKSIVKARPLKRRMVLWAEVFFPVTVSKMRNRKKDIQLKKTTDIIDFRAEKNGRWMKV